MKKYLLSACLCCLSVLGAGAKDDKDSNVSYLPEKGDFSIGLDVTPLLDYVGNIFNGTAGNKMGNISGEPVTSDIEGFNIDNIAPNVSIMGKYMLTDEFALKANIGIMLRTNQTRAYVRDDMAYINDPLSEAELIDSRKIRRNGMSIMLGGEYRKGSRRIQGVFGAGLITGFNRSVTKYRYANELTAMNPLPTISWNTYSGAYRTLTSKSASNFFIGVAGSVGVECFVAPKIALGAEVNLALYYVKGGQEYTTSEGYNTIKDVVETRNDTKAPGSNAFRLGTENLGGALYLSFYF